MDFSVLIRTFNAERYLKEAIDSILNQTCGCNIEVIILYDEGSTDRTWNIIEDIKKKTILPPNISLKVVRHTHMTLPRATQLGLKEAKGNYVTFLDYDNIYPPDYLEKIYEAINKYKDSTFIFSKAIVIDENKNILHELINMPNNPYDVNLIIFANYIDSNTIIIEKSCKEKIVELLDRLKHTYFDWVFEDWLIATLGLRFCKPLYVRNAYIYYRVHESNLTFSRRIAADPKSLFNVEREIKTLIAMLYILDDRKLNYKILRALVARYITIIRLTSEIAGASLMTTLLLGLRHVMRYISITQIFKRI